jgi:hypothetical protein
LILDVKRFWRGRYREPMSGAATCGLAAGQENQNAIRVRMVARSRRKSSWIFGEASSLAFLFWKGAAMPSEEGRRIRPALNAAHSGGFRFRENVQMSLIQNGRGERI